MNNCIQCNETFEITEKDKVFHSEMDLPEAKKCPICRLKNRMVFRNESTLYHRKCDKTGKQIISAHKPEALFPVYCSEEWANEGWDGKDYGQDYDFNRPFFEQFYELRNKVPHQALTGSVNENCDFCNVVGNCKNCYLCYGSIECEDCYYGSPFKSKNCVDSLVLRESELCIECMDSIGLYNCYQCQNCSHSTNLKFCIEAHNCQDCFACVGINRKQYCILNKQYSKEDYDRIMSEIDLCNPHVYNKILTELEALRLKLPHKSYLGTNNENVTGNYIFNSKDCHDVYNVEKCQDVAYSYQLQDVYSSQDINNGEYGHHNYQLMAHYNQVSNCFYCYYLWDVTNNLWYCGNCTQNVKDCFGCVGLKKSQYCILNKQYTKEEYEAMLPKIIEHMKQTGEWGEFFPPYISAFAYNESVAMEHFPVEKEEALKSGFTWYDGQSNSAYQGPKTEVPQNINEVDPDICSKILICEVTGKTYKIIAGELAAYKRMQVPIPKRSPKQRHIDRLAKRNPMKLWTRNCDKCAVEITTSFSPDRPEIVYCEKCYLADLR